MGECHSYCFSRPVSRLKRSSLSCNSSRPSCGTSESDDLRVAESPDHCHGSVGDSHEECLYYLMVATLVMVYS